MFDYQKNDCEVLLQKALDELACQSGYDEVRVAPLFPFGHSVGSIFASRVACWAPRRCFGALAFKGGLSSPADQPSALAGVPILVIKGSSRSSAPAPAACSAPRDPRDSGAACPGHPPPSRAGRAAPAGLPRRAGGRHFAGRPAWPRRRLHPPVRGSGSRLADRPAGGNREVRPKRARPRRYRRPHRRLPAHFAGDKEEGDLAWTSPWPGPTPCTRTWRQKA